VNKDILISLIMQPAAERFCMIDVRMYTTVA